MKHGPYYEPGRYRCEITDQGLTKASTGTVQIALKFRVLEGVQPACDLDNQYERTAFLPVTEKTMPYLIPKLQSLGYTRDSIRHLDLNSPQAHDLRGQEAEFICRHENDQNGDRRERWDVWANTVGALELKPPDPKDIRALDMLFNRARKESPHREPQPVAQLAEYASDDDVPF